MTDNHLELTFLKQAVERKFGSVPSTTAAFVRLSEDMGDRISPSTLKRLWGYVGMTVEPRTGTLNTLSRYAGFRDYKAFCEDLQQTKMSSSGYFNAARIDAASLQKGDVLRIGWRPDRIVALVYQGGRRFRVVSSENSKLEAGDEFEVQSIVKGFPLIIPEIHRNGARTASFIAGRDGGIVFIKAD